MRLVMFDFDGTLRDKMKADEECIIRSLAEASNFDTIDTGWAE